MEQEIAYRIEVRGARGIMPMDPNGQSDPYCLAGVADPITNEFVDPSSILRSKTHFVTLTPVWKGFFLIMKSPDTKVRVEVWDKDQAETDDFEGLAIVDPIACTQAADTTELWLPLTGRTEDEKVTGEVNVVVLKGPLHELESRIGTIKDSTQDLKPEKKEDDATIKKLQAELKTKGGKMEQLKESYSVLDMHFVKAKGQLEQLQAELAAKNGQLEAQAAELAKAKSYAAELQQALQEKQKVSQLVKEWNDNAQMLDRLQAQLKATSSRHKKGSQEKTEESSEAVPKARVEERETEWLSVGKVMEQWTEYTNLIEVLEATVKEKSEQLENSRIEQEKQLNNATQQIESLKKELALKSEEFETQSLKYIEQTQQLHESAREIDLLKLGVKEMEEQLLIKREQERQLQETQQQVEALLVEIKVKSGELNQQTTQIEKYKVDLQTIEEVQATLKQKDEELIAVREVNVEIEQKCHQQAKILESVNFELTTKTQKLQSLETELEETTVRVTKEKQEVIDQLHAELIKQTQRVEELTVVDSESKTENLTLASRNEELSDEKTLLENRVKELTQQLRMRTEECSKMEEEVKQMKHLLEGERENAKSKALAPDEDEVVTVRAKKRVQEQEVVTLGGGAQFSAHAKPLDDEPVAAKHGEGKEKEETDTAQYRTKQDQEEHASTKDLFGVQLDELERLDEGMTAAQRANAPLLEGHSLPALPRTHEVAVVAQNKKRFCCFAG